MRQSLSLSRSRDQHAAVRAVAIALALSVGLAAVAVVDQLAGHSLTDHASAMYARHGEQASAGLLYGLVYTVAVVATLLWLSVMRALLMGRRWAPVLAGAVVTITAMLAVLLLTSTEYGGRIFPPLWGILAILPSVSGVVAVACALGRSRGGASA